MRLNDSLPIAMEEDTDVEMKSVLERDFDNVEDSLGDVLHHEVQCSNASIVQHLLELGCDVDTLNNDMKTPLLVAFENSDFKTMEVLIKAKANIYHVGAEGKTIAQMVFESKKMCLFTIHTFLDRIKADFSYNKDVLVQMLVKVKCSMCDAGYFEDIQLMSELLKNGVDINSPAPSRHNRTALHEATKFGDEQIVEWLITNGANVNALDDKGRSPLYIAAKRTDVHILRLLLEHGADPNIIDKKYDSAPLNILFENSLDSDHQIQFDKCIELLLEYNAIPRSAAYDYTLFDYALAGNQLQRVDLLIGYLAMIDARNGSSHKDSVMYFDDDDYLHLQSKLDEYYKSCRHILGLTVHKKTSLLDLLTMSQEKMKLCVRDVNFLSTVASIDKETRDRFPFYFKRLMKRIDQAVVNVQLENAAIVSLCKLFGSNYNESYIFARKVAGYLNVEDLTQLKKASET